MNTHIGLIRRHLRFKEVSLWSELCVRGNELAASKGVTSFSGNPRTNVRPNTVTVPRPKLTSMIDEQPVFTAHDKCHSLCIVRISFTRLHFPSFAHANVRGRVEKLINTTHWISLFVDYRSCKRHKCQLDNWRKIKDSNFCCPMRHRVRFVKRIARFSSPNSSGATLETALLCSSSKIESYLPLDRLSGRNNQ